MLSCKRNSTPNVSTNQSSEYSKHGPVRILSAEEISAEYPPRPKSKKSYSQSYVPPERQAQWDAWAEYIRIYEPFSWFCTFTFKKDILTYAQENPCVHKARYEWKDKTGKHDNGTYVRGYSRERWPDAAEYERTAMYVQNVQEEHSVRMYRRWARKLNEEVFGMRYRNHGKGLLHVYAIEYQKRGVAHIHSLIKDVPESCMRKRFERIWEGLHSNNGYANIFPYDPERGATGYISKYVLKGGKVDMIAPRNVGSTPIWAFTLSMSLPQVLSEPALSDEQGYSNTAQEKGSSGPSPGF